MRTLFKLFAIVVASLLVLSILTTVAMAAGGASQGLGNSGQMGKMGKSGGDSSGLMSQGGGMMNQMQEKERMRQMIGESARLGLFGGFDETGPLFQGRFLSFMLNETSGSLTNYTVATSGGEEMVFAGISLRDFVPDTVSTTGSLFIEENSSFSIVVHDNPVALLHVSSNRSMENVNFTLGPGMSAVILPKNGNDSNASFALVSGTGVQGVLTAKNGNLSIESNNIGSVFILANASDVMFRMKPALAKGHMALDDAVQDAITNGQVAGELSITVRNGSAMYDLMQYRMGFGLKVQQAEENHLRLEVSSSEHAGKVAIVNLDQGTFDTRTRNDIMITLDGNGVRQTQNPLDVLSASGSQDNDAIYCITNTDNGSQTLVYIPSFSTHVLDLSSVSPLASVLSITGLLAVLGAMVAVGAAAFLLQRRKG